MLLVIESRADLAPIPTESAPRSTECALRHMGWPFPVSDTTPRRAPPVRATALATPAPPASLPIPALEPRRNPRPALPLFALELAEAH